MANQSEEILNYIEEHPGTCTEGIVSGTGRNRHLVEVATKLMVKQGLIRETGKDKWGDSSFEADLGYIHHSKAIGTWEDIKRDLESLEKGNFGPSAIQKAASMMSGFATGFVNPFLSLSQLIADSREHERSLVEIAALANVTPTELAEFYQSTPYSLEFIKTAIQAGAKLDEEDIKRTMEESYLSTEKLKAIIASGSDQEHTFIITLPNNDRREVKAAYMEVDGAALYFEDEDHETILAFGPGHWVWAERKEPDESST